MKLLYRISETISILIVIAIALAPLGCGVDPGIDWIGNTGVYNYSASIIQTGNVRQVWWCGQAVNPNDHKQDTDTIQYESINLLTKSVQGPQTVLSETPDSWDSAYTCNPRVIGGIFNDPFGDGHSYSYAMYYVGSANRAGLANSIGVAFSNDGVNWRKHPEPIINSDTPVDYGVGQPVAYNRDGKAGITLFYEDINPGVRHVAATSNDAIHFIVEGTLTTAGLDPNDPNPSWGDMAYDMKTNFWYAIYNELLRPSTTTGGVIERGQFGVELYRIPANGLLTGASPWQRLGTIDTSSTSYESNFIAGFVRDSYDNLNVGSYPDIEMYVAESDQSPSWNASPAAAAKSAEPPSWQLHLQEWIPNSPVLSLSRYYNGHVHEVTTGWVDPSGGFAVQSVLGGLYPTPEQGATVPFYGCKRGSTDYFISLDSACGGQRILGTVGYGYSQAVAGLNLVALYSCKTDHDHFVSKDPKCEGQTVVQLLGYAAP